MKHTIHLKVSPEALKHAIHAIMKTSELPDPVSLTGAVRTCFNMGIAALDPGHHLRNVPEPAEALYCKLTGSRETQPDEDTLHKLVSQNNCSPTNGDPRLSNVPPKDRTLAMRIIASTECQDPLPVEHHLESDNPNVVRLAKLIWPTEAEAHQAEGRRPNHFEKPKGE